MGYVVEDYVIASTWKEDHLISSHEKALELFGEKLVTPMFPHGVNGCKTFFVISSGSKSGWIDKSDHEEKIKQFINWHNGKELYTRLSVVHVPEDRKSYVGIDSDSGVLI